MFTNKGFAWKLGAGLSAAVALGMLSAAKGPPIDLGLWSCLTEPVRRDGTPLRLLEARVVESDAAGFEIEDRGLRIRVSPAAAVAPGEAVRLRAIFRIRGPHLELQEVQKIHPARIPPGVSLAVSILVLAGVLFNLHRHFAVRPRVIHVLGAREEDGREGTA